MEIKTLQHKIFGKPKDINDPHLFHKMALIPALAWIGLGADGLSSSSYGPEEAFRVIVEHPYLAVLLALATGLTVFIISYAYSRIIEYFPTGGGGYIVATHTLGKKAGVVSGSALIVDYILTITVSVACCGNALFSFLPLHYQQYKLGFEIVAILFLIVMNIRGVKESIEVLTPIFIIFLLTHALMIGYGIFSHASEVHVLSANMSKDFNSGLSTLGWLGMTALFLRAYSMGGGTYTGIEAVSNGLQIMKEPKVKTGKRTMLYMASSLAITAGGLLVCYLLVGVRPMEGQTMNAILAKALYSNWSWGKELALITILSEGALLIVGAQAGFIDGPRVMANMALDNWFPRKFASLSERLTMRNGVLLMGGASLALLLYTHGSIGTLIVMYSINVFLTFSLSELGMSKFFIKNRKTDPKWKHHLPVHLIGLVLCSTVLVVTSYEKIGQGGWLTLVVTSLVIFICYLIKKHYNKVKVAMNKLNSSIHENMPSAFDYNNKPVDPKEMTSIQLVSGFSSLGIQTLLSVLHNFPWLYKNVVFISICAVDVDSFRDKEQLTCQEEATKQALEKYVDYARRLGMPATYKYAVGTDVTALATQLCIDASKEFPNSTIFAGKLTFQQERFYHKILHNDTSMTIQKNLQQFGITTVILPVNVNLE